MNFLKRYEEKKPILTILVLAIMTIIFIRLSFDPNLDESGVLEKIGVMSPDNIFDGNYWALLSSTFVHIEDWHFFSNFIWIFVFGAALEYELGKIKWVAFYIVSAVVSSLSEIVFSGSTGIGASGVVYAMFGFIWVIRRVVTRFDIIVPDSLVKLFIAWIFIGLLTNELGISNIGNAAHISGLLVGVGLGWLYRLWIKRKRNM